MLCKEGTIQFKIISNNLYFIQLLQFLTVTGKTSVLSCKSK